MHMPSIKQRIELLPSTPPYHADFDGDEVNMQYVLHLSDAQISPPDAVLSIPQSEETHAELSQIAWVPRQVRV
jgi:DNA-directed RNA polymerase II subunit RPB1